MDLFCPPTLTADTEINEGGVDDDTGAGVGIAGATARIGAGVDTGGAMVGN